MAQGRRARHRWLAVLRPPRLRDGQLAQQSRRLNTPHITTEGFPDMNDKKVWLITGAGRGMGVDIVRAALSAGHVVVATGRQPAKVTSALGAHDNLHVIELDITDPASAQ